MNGKQAKRLRRAALGLGVTLSEAGKTIEKDGYEVRTHSKTLGAGAPSHQLVVRKDSVKGFYKQFKRGV